MKKLLWPAIETLAVVLLIVGLIATMKGIFGNRYEAELAAIRAKGEPVTLGELLGDPIPDDVNAAVPYMQLMADTQSGTYQQPLKLLDELKQSPGGSMTADSWAKAEKVLAATQPLRALIEDAVSRPQCRFEPNTKNPITILFPYYAPIRKGQQILRLSALVNARNGRIDQAAQDIETEIGVAQSLRNEPFLIGQLVRTALLNIAMKNIQDVSQFGDLSEDQARRIFDALGRVDMAASAKRAWEGERVTFMCLADPKYVQQSASTAAGSTSVLSNSGYSLWSRTMMRGDLATYLSLVSRQVDGAKLGFAEAKAQGLFEEPKDLPVYAIVTKMIMPGTSKLGMKRYATEAELAKTRIFLAVQAYKARYGEYPASLDQILARLGWKLPKDPFGGHDLIYKRRDKGFIVYSIGPDLKDDGGRPIPNESLEAGDKGDIVLMWDR